MKINIEIDGQPIAKARPRFFRRGKGIGTYNPQETEEGLWILQAQKSIERHTDVLPTKAPVRIACEFWLRRPAGHFSRETLKQSAPTHHTKKPDLDNLVKFVLDCLNHCRIWHDDSQVVAITASKSYSDHKPRSVIEIAWD